MREPRIDFIDLVQSLTLALDLVDKGLVRHHVRVAYIAKSLSKMGDLNRKQENDVFVASLLHDLGAVWTDDRSEFFHYKLHHPHRHAEVGYQLLHDFDLFEHPATIIRHHHVCWEDGAGHRFCDQKVPFESHVIHLADRVDVLIDYQSDIHPQIEHVLTTVKGDCPDLFHPLVVDWFTRLVQRDDFWFELTSPDLSHILRRWVKGYEIDLTHNILASFAHLLSQLVDFQSRFTSTHSQGVAAVAESIARIIGFSGSECRKIAVAGLLHDVGKLAIPRELLEKNGALSSAEFNIIKSHTYHTMRILEPIQGIDEVIQWCVFHHERLNGSGYPFRKVAEELPFAARIVAVADIFTALSEDRPYRLGMSEMKVRDIFAEQVENGLLDGKVVHALVDHYDAVNEERLAAQRQAHSQYQEFTERIKEFDFWSRSLDHLSANVESGQALDVSIRRQFVNIRSILGQTLSDHAAMIIDKRIVVTNTLSEYFRLFADPVLLKQVVLEIMAYALHYCGQEDALRIHHQDVTAGLSGFAITIAGPSGTKSGAGSCHVHGDGKVAESHLPTGPQNLYLARRILASHQGSLQIIPDQASGFTMVVRLPRVQPTVMIVDDDPDLLKFMVKKLEAMELSVTGLDSSQEAYRRLLDGLQPHLLIADVFMPDLDGFQLLEAAHSSGRDIPVILVTADESRATREKAFQLGAADFVTKPIVLHDFIPRVRKHFG
ncbi:MAG: HD domain-containing protein [Magnetococcales bacterium]|nr:HD domain-containing protein [Magnetococcales bacterium]MBF0322471.1 HD domain-containing protein [Magnetococcales bacterium]